MFETKEQAQQALAETGFNLNNNGLRQRLELAQARARKEAQDQVHPVTNPEAAKRLEGLLNLGTISTVGFVTLLFVVVLFGLFVVEAVAVYHGYKLVLHPAEAALFSIVTLSAFYVLMFVSEAIAPPRTETQDVKPSLRHTVNKARYWVAFGKDWQPEHEANPEYVAASRVQKTLVRVIVITSVTGRLEPLLTEAAGMPALAGLRLLITQSSILDYISAFIIGLATFVILSVSHYLFEFTYRNFVRITGGLDLGKSGSADYDALYETLSERYITETLTAQVLNEWGKQGRVSEMTAQYLPSSVNKPSYSDESPNQE